MTKNVVAARSDTPVTEIISLMVKYNVGTIPIVDSKNIPLRVVTESDIVREATIGRGISPLVDNEDIISSTFVTLVPEVTVEIAAHEMISQRARILVTSKIGVLEGIITTTDFLRFFTNTLEDRPIPKVFISGVKTLDIHSSLKQAIDLMFTKKIGSVVLTTDGMPSAIVTERSLLSTLHIKGNKLESTLLEEVATKPLITAAFGVTVKEAASILLDKGIKRLPLMKGETLAGITTSLDLVKAFLAKVEVRMMR